MATPDEDGPPPPPRGASVRELGRNGGGANDKKDKDKEKKGIFGFGGKKSGDYIILYLLGIVIIFYISFFIGKTDRPEISSPVDFEHTVHVGFDPGTGEFTVRKRLLY